jgi:hypothetical protein
MTPRLGAGKRGLLLASPRRRAVPGRLRRGGAGAPAETPCYVFDGAACGQSSARCDDAAQLRRAAAR